MNHVSLNLQRMVSELFYKGYREPKLQRCCIISIHKLVQAEHPGRSSHRGVKENFRKSFAWCETTGIEQAGH
jgi:hypothetical protein